MAPPPSADAARQVRLEQISFPRLLFALLHQRFTGTLAIEQPASHAESAAQRTIWFRGGMPVFTDWASPGLVLGRIMVGDALITELQLEAALRSMAEDGRLLGETLVTQGAAEPRTVTEALRRQCTAKLIEMFALRAGTITVSAAPHELSDELASVNVLGLIMAGVAAHYDIERIAAEMGTALGGSVSATTALQRYRAHFGFRDDDARLIEAIIRGGVTLDRLEHLAPSTERAARIVYSLWTCQMLRVGEATSTAVPRTTSTSRSPGAPMPVARDRDAAAPTVGRSPKEPSDGGREPPTISNEAFVAELAELEAKIEAKAHPFDLLGIPVSAGKKDIRHAFAELSRTFHPDALQAAGLGHLRDRVSRAFAALSEAQMLLGDKQKRDELRESIERGDDPSKSSGPDATAMARAAFESELIAKEADKLLRAARFDRALDRYESAAALAPEEADLQAAIAWCRYNVSPKDKASGARAEAILTEITRANPKLARAHYFRGLVLKDLGRDQAAIEALTQAHSHDPRLIDAERHARALRMRAGRPADASSRGKGESSGRFGLKGLFGKK